MKKFLVLIPLLSACAPAFNGTNNPTPFKTGQQWRVSSTSALDAKLAPSTTFGIADVKPERDSWYITPQGENTGDLNLFYNADPNFVIMIDETGLNQEASRVRFCVINMNAGEDGKYSGYATHPLAVQLPTIFKSDYKTALSTALDKNSNSTSTSGVTGYRNQLYKSIAEAIDPTDNAPCTLEFVK